MQTLPGFRVASGILTFALAAMSGAGCSSASPDLENVGATSSAGEGSACVDPANGTSLASGSCVCSEAEKMSICCDNGVVTSKAATCEDAGAPSPAASDLADDALNDMLSHAVLRIRDPKNSKETLDLRGFWTENHDAFQEAQSADKNDRYGAQFINTGYWTNSQALDAVLDGVDRTGGKDFKDWIPKVVEVCRTQYEGWFEPAYHQTFIDDVTWMTLALLHAYDVAHKYHLANEGAYLANAEDVFKAVYKYGPTTPFEGLWWNITPNVLPDYQIAGNAKITHAYDELAAASNFPPVIAAARIAERTSDRTLKAMYEKAALKWYATWLSRGVRNEPHGLWVAGSIKDGSLTSYKFTYLQGAGIGAALEMANIDPDNRAKYIGDAHGMADYLVNEETIAVPGLGPVLIDGGPDSPADGSGSALGFKGIGYRYLAALYESDRSHASERTSMYGQYYAVLQASYEGIISRAHDHGKREIGFRWDEIYTDQTSSDDEAAFGNLGSNASAVMAIQIFTPMIGE